MSFEAHLTNTAKGHLDDRCLGFQLFKESREADLVRNGLNATPADLPILVAVSTSRINQSANAASSAFVFMRATQ